MKAIIYLILICQTIAVYSQNTFEIVITNPLQYSTPTNCIEDHKGDFVVIITQTKLSDHSRSTHLMKIKNNGNTMLNRICPMIDNSEQVYIIETPDSNYLSIGRINTDTSAFGHIYLVKYDPMFNTIWEKSYKLDNSKCYSLNYYKADDHLFICGSDDIDTLSSSFTRIFMLKISYDGNLLSRTYLPYSGIFKINTIIENADMNGYKVFVEGSDSILSTMTEIITVDSNLQVISFVPKPTNDPLHVQYGNTAKRFSDSTYLLGGSKMVYDMACNTFARDLNVYLISEDNQQILNEYEFGKTDTIDQAAYNGSIDFIDKDNIFLYGDVCYIEFWATEPNWLIIEKLDSNLILKWRKYYGGDAYYTSKMIKATIDGGCIILATKYDADYQNSEQDIYILKLDANGEMISNEPNIGIQIKDILVYPNPGNNRLYFQTAIDDEILLELYDAKGLLLKSEIIQGGEKSVDVSLLPEGIYFYRFSTDEGLIDSGKWIKQ